jgi:hypothetical protein
MFDQKVIFIKEKYKTFAREDQSFRTNNQELQKVDYSCFGFILVKIRYFKMDKNLLTVERYRI